MIIANLVRGHTKGWRFDGHANYFCLIIEPDDKYNYSSRPLMLNGKTARVVTKKYAIALL